HALGRLTSGPRPGDMEQVKKIGLKKWIDQQLNPESIPENPELAAKLRPLESLGMSNQQIAENYPPPQLVVAVAAGRVPLPQDPEKRATLERLAARYKNKLQKKGKDEDSKLTPAEKTPMNELLTPSEMQTFRKGTPEEKV